MRTLIVGAGATGGYYGGRLAQAGRDVSFLVRGARMQQLQRDGLQIVSRLGDVAVRPSVITASELKDQAPYDCIVLTTKSYSLPSALADIAPVTGPNTILLPILNGMRHLDVITERFGRERVMGGSVRIVADLDSEGRVVQMTDLDGFTFGELDGSRSERAERMLREFTVHGFTATLSENIVGAMWQKWWMLATMGAVCIVSRGTVGEMAAVPYGTETATAILHEAADIAAANGFPATQKSIEEQTRRFTEAGSSLTSSMYRDMMRGAPVEADQILGDLLARAKDVSAPLLKGAYVQLKVYEAKLAGV